MRLHTQRSLLLATFGLVASQALATNPPWSTGFESSYSTGYLSGQNSWSNPTHYFQVANSDSHAGTYHVNISVDDFSNYGYHLGLGFNSWMGGYDEASFPISYSPGTYDDPIVEASCYMRILWGHPQDQMATAGMFRLYSSSGNLVTISVRNDATFQMGSDYCGTIPQGIENSEFNEWNLYVVRADLERGLVSAEAFGNMLGVCLSPETDLASVKFYAGTGDTSTITHRAQATVGWDDVSITTKTRCSLADFDMNGVINEGDFAVFSTQYNIYDCSLMPFGKCPGDLNSDGFVDDDDFVILNAMALTDCQS